MNDSNDIAFRDAVEQYEEQLDEQAITTDSRTSCVQATRSWIDWLEDSHGATHVSELRPYHLAHYAGYCESNFRAATSRIRLVRNYRFIRYLGDCGFIDDDLLLALRDTYREATGKWGTKRSGIPLRDALAEYVEHLNASGYANATITTRHSRLKLWLDRLEHEEGVTHTTELRPSQRESIVANLNCSRGTEVALRNAINRFLTYLGREGHLDPASSYFISQPEVDDE